VAHLPEQEWLDVHDASRYVGMHPQTLARLIRRRQVPVRIFNYRFLIRRRDLLPWKRDDGGRR